MFLNLLIGATLLIFCLPLMLAGLKASIMHDGPGIFKLVGMLWRGEIKTRKVR